VGLQQILQAGASRFRLGCRPAPDLLAQALQVGAGAPQGLLPARSPPGSTPARAAVGGGMPLQAGPWWLLLKHAASGAAGEG
jgi:hypothetical protein